MQNILLGSAAWSDIKLLPMGYGPYDSSLNWDKDGWRLCEIY